MRTIKFRGKRVDTKEWVYGSLIYRKHGKNSLVGEYSCFIVLEDDEVALRSLKTMENSYEFRCVQVIPETVGQFTGLTDKNGKEIYEGDILDNGEYKCFLLYHRGAYRVHFNIKDLEQFESCEYVYDYERPYMEYKESRKFRHNPKKFVVIGNIHDNQELLK